MAENDDDKDNFESPESKPAVKAKSGKGKPSSASSPMKDERHSGKKSAGSNRGTSGGKRKSKTPVKREEEMLPSGVITDTGEEIFPLVLTSKTQEIFQCRVDEDVTQDSLYKLLKKEDILHDMKTRAAISDFHPVKQLVINYPGEELLLVFDRDFKYGQNFYLVGSEASKETILHPPEILTEREEGDEGSLDAYVYKPIEPRPWICLGSEQEVEEELVEERPWKIKYMFSRVRKEFGAPINFTDRNASLEKDSYLECPSYEDKSFNIKQMEKDIAVQVVPLLQEACTQTKWAYPRNACIQYIPREFTDKEKEDCMKSKNFKDFINHVALRCEIALQQNEIMDAFFDDWKALAGEERTFGGKSDTLLKEYQSFTDLHYSKEKTVSWVDWHPVYPGIIAVAVTERLSFEEKINLSSRLLLTPSLILIWSFTDPIHPELLLECPNDIFCFKFCPSDPNIIAGGCVNGQLVLWDISGYAERLSHAKIGGGRNLADKANIFDEINEEDISATPLIRYCAVSSIEFGHKTAITDLHWLPDYYEITRMGIPHENKSGVCVQLVTCAPDCSVLFWDIRQPKIIPISMQDKKKHEEKQLDNPHGVPNTFKHLDLTWKPFIKVSLSRIGTSGEYSPLTISIRDGHLSHGSSDKTQNQTAVEKQDRGVSYSSLRVPSPKHLKQLEGISTSFYIGTEDGELVYSDWKMEKDSDTGKLFLQRSPFFQDIILTVGGWTLAIWKEGVTTGPILQACCYQKRYTAGYWSLSRAGVFFIGKEDGSIDIWDLLEKTHECSQTQNISTSAITAIRPWIFSSKQHILAVADDFGTLHVLEIPWTLRHPSSNEKSSIQYYFEREIQHLEYFEERKIFRAKEKREMEAEEQRKKTLPIPPEISPEQMEKEECKEYQNYLALEREILIQLGLVSEAD
nr:PREDICTED: WD repeat-containing protein 63 isoform X2 [Latimeria chalumnae]|eukprot:XP_014342639.1 PREDICTED: WD repeat-containing protein 63 isoform X2 [Latimeria chalumnae]